MPRPEKLQEEDDAKRMFRPKAEIFVEKRFSVSCSFSAYLTESDSDESRSGLHDVVNSESKLQFFLAAGQLILRFVADFAVSLRKVKMFNVVLL